MNSARASGKRAAPCRGTAAWSLVLLTTAGCASGSGTGDGAASPVPAASSPPAARQTTAVVTPPALNPGSGEVTAGQHGPAHGNARFSYDAGTPGKALIVEASCLGAGTIDVALPAVGAGFRHKCGTDEPLAAHNELGLEAARAPGTVKVTAPSTVTWAVTVGRGDLVEQESLTTG